MGELDRYKEISKKLAVAKGLTDEPAHKLAAEAPVPGTSQMFP